MPITIAPEPLPDDSLRTVPLHRATDPSAHDETQAGVRRASRHLHRKSFRAHPSALCARSRVVAARANAKPHRESRRARLILPRCGNHAGLTKERRAALLRADRRNEALAALGSAPLDDLAAGLGAHAGTKAMSSLSSNAARLKSSFHGDLPARWGASAKNRRARLPTRTSQCQAESTRFTRRRTRFWW